MSSADSATDHGLSDLDERPGRRYPDDREADPVQLSFQEFCLKADELYATLQEDTITTREEVFAAQEFYRFVLAGRLRKPDGDSGHITLNACDNLPNNIRYEVSRDYDSLIGISHDLPYSKHLELTPVPPFRHTLKTDNHMKAKAYLHGRETLVSMHTIPNFCFGKVANRSVIRVFLPRMVGKYASRAIPAQDLELIYDRCLRPLVRKHLQNMASHWPASYTSAIALYRDNTGRVHEGSLDIPAHILDTFGEEYLNILSSLRPYFRDAYFVHEFRGWKASSVHDPLDQVDRELALDKFTDVLLMDKVDPKDWYIDVGLEFGHVDHVVTWRDSGHEALLAHCLPSVDQDIIDSIVDKSTFHIDRMMHLKDLTGFRYAPGFKGRTDKVHYIQAYTTEKTMSYQLHPGLFTPMDPNSLLTSSNLKALLEKIQDMSKILFQCTADGDEARKAQEGCARLEVRVGFSKALTALTTIPNNIYQYCLVPLPAKTWWWFKWYRLAAVHMVIKNLLHSHVRDRKSDCALGLGAVMIWIINGLYRRPMDRFLQLAKEVCQHVPTDYDNYVDGLETQEDDAIMPLMYEAGLYFVCDVVTDSGGTFRLPYHKAISDEAFQSAFRLTLHQVRHIMGVADHDLPRTVANPQRTTNRSKRHTLHVQDIRPQDRPLPNINENLLENIHIHPARRVQGPDVDDFARHGGGNRDVQMLLMQARHDDEDTPTRVKLLLEQFFYDMVEESPNKKAAVDGPWINIPIHQRTQEATEHLFQSFGLPFFAAQYTFCTPEQWDMHFTRLFPPRLPTTWGQNFRKATYYRQWLDMIDSLDDQSREGLQAAIRTKFDSLVWIPYTGSDRMWCTRPIKGRGWFTLPQGHPPSGPQIAFNPNARYHGLYAPFLRPAPSTDSADEAMELDNESDEQDDHGGQHNPLSPNQHHHEVANEEDEGIASPHSHRFTSPNRYSYPSVADEEDEELFGPNPNSTRNGSVWAPSPHRPNFSTPSSLNQLTPLSFRGQSMTSASASPWSGRLLPPYQMRPTGSPRYGVGYQPDHLALWEERQRACSKPTEDGRTVAERFTAFTQEFPRYFRDQLKEEEEEDEDDKYSHDHLKEEEEEESEEDDKFPQYSHDHLKEEEEDDESDGYRESAQSSDDKLKGEGEEWLYEGLPRHFHDQLKEEDNGGLAVDGEFTRHVRDLMKEEEEESDEEDLYL